MGLCLPTGHLNRLSQGSILLTVQRTSCLGGYLVVPTTQTAQEAAGAVGSENTLTSCLSPARVKTFRCQNMLGLPCVLLQF